jgi:hypothetical protein
MKNHKIQNLVVLAVISLIVMQIGLAGCGSVELGISEAGSLEGNEIEVGIEPTPTPQVLSYTNTFYGFQFNYPETWTLTEIDHGVVLMKGNNRLGINFRWINEDMHSYFGRTGMGAGTPIYSGKVYFLGQVIPENWVELEHLVKYVLYSDTGLIEIDDIAFSIVLEDLETDYMLLNLPEEIIAETRTILETFQRIEATGSNPLTVPTQEPVPAATEEIIVDMFVYENLEYGFSFQYPYYLSVVEEPNKVQILYAGNCQMTIAYRRVGEDIHLTDVGEQTGEFHPYVEVPFLGSPVQAILKIQDDLISAAYLGGPGVELGEGTPLRFVISIVNTEGERLANAQVDEMIQILQSFGLTD